MYAQHTHTPHTYTHTPHTHIHTHVHILYVHSEVKMRAHDLTYYSHRKSTLYFCLFYICMYVCTYVCQLVIILFICIAIRRISVRTELPSTNRDKDWSGMFGLWSDALSSSVSSYGLMPCHLQCHLMVWCLDIFSVILWSDALSSSLFSASQDWFISPDYAPDKGQSMTGCLKSKFLLAQKKVE